MCKFIVSMNTSVKKKKKCKNHGIAIKDVNLGASSCLFAI